MKKSLGFRNRQMGEVECLQTMSASAKFAKDLNVCENREIDDKEFARKISLLRTTRDMRFVSDSNASVLKSLVDPVTMYSVSFARVLDERISERVHEMFVEEARDIVGGEQDDQPGYVYCFHELSDAPDILKIGRTSRTPPERIAEWERELSPHEGLSVKLLFAHRTTSNKFAERIVQELLRCEHIVNRINPVTGDELVEFYRLDNVMAANVFVRQVLLFVDRWCADAASRVRRPRYTARRRQSRWRAR